jgi:hypothetical protein
MRNKTFTTIALFSILLNSCSREYTASNPYRSLEHSYFSFLKESNPINTSLDSELGQTGIGTLSAYHSEYLNTEPRCAPIGTLFGKVTDYPPTRITLNQNNWNFSSHNFTILESNANEIKSFSFQTEDKGILRGNLVKKCNSLHYWVYNIDGLEKTFYILKFKQ